MKKYVRGRGGRTCCCRKVRHIVCVEGKRRGGRAFVAKFRYSFSRSCDFYSRSDSTCCGGVVQIAGTKSWRAVWVPAEQTVDV